MIVEAKNKKQIILSKFNLVDVEQLSNYLCELSEETKKRFGPHPYDKNSIVAFYESHEPYIGYIAQDIHSMKIIAYAIIKMGYLDHDSFRLESYGLNLDRNSDCTFAPSVADRWQNQGIGNKIFHFILADLKIKNIQRIILWGGVQAGNKTAINYYLNNGFKILGKFDYNGENYDMTLDIT